MDIHLARCECYKSIWDTHETKVEMHMQLQDAFFASQMSFFLWTGIKETAALQ
jgi:hypothetical protein